ncbi:hypothetical protein MKX34_30775 [Paenibacillus sp. FSL R5-0636]|uniref:hypothetical protein n=1 Tax=Paenibacillus sp. FSL R5-0636 TaxID=2921652 RepID=UPI0030D06446
MIHSKGFGYSKLSLHLVSDWIFQHTRRIGYGWMLEITTTGLAMSTKAAALHWKALYLIV